MENIVHTPEQLGKVLRGRRKTMQLSQIATGAAVGLLAKTVSKLELDPATATVESLFKLISALQLELVVRARPVDDAPSHEW